MNKRVGLLVNFSSYNINEGIRRIVNWLSKISKTPSIWIRVIKDIFDISDKDCEWIRVISEICVR
jgi:hypothetical protein